jgi:neopullulanase
MIMHRAIRHLPAVLATGALAALLFACSDSSPMQPCQADCGAHGACVVRQGHEQCVCGAGYAGSACGECASGYVEAAGACAPDPCQPNPCQEPHKHVCAVAAGAASCQCDEGAQDHDGDGSCRPTCAEATQGYGAQPCDDSSGEAVFTGGRTCASLITYAPATPPAGQVYVRGELNNWSLDDPMVLGADGAYTLTKVLAAGSYAYKLYDQGKDQWLEDPTNPFHKWVGGERNSRLVVEDCNVPLLRLMHQPELTGGEQNARTVSFAVQYVDGASGAGLSAAGVTATRDGTPVTLTAGANGVVSVVDLGLGPGKYAYRFEASDAQGRAARRLYVPVWVEVTPFEWRDAVLYFALTDRFLDGDAGNNAPVAGVDDKLNWHGGDFAGLKAKLEEGYFDQLGVSAIWLSSISQNTGRSWAGDDGRQATGYHSYWPISTGWRDDAPLPGVEAVEPHFGDLDEFKALVEAAHRRGIRVLVDLVANHVHSDSPLWTNHQGDNPPWFNLPEEDCVPSNWARPITCWFAPYLPDLHYETEAVMDLMAAHAAWLVEETDIDGFRLDAVKHMIDDFTYAVRGTLDRRLRYSAQRFYMVGETFTGETDYDLIQRYVSPAQLDGQFDFPLYWQVTATLLREERDLSALAGMVKSNDGRYGDDAIMSTFMGNHDVCRALSHAAGAFGDMWCNDGKAIGWSSPPALPTGEEPFQRLRLAWTFLMTSPGIPLIYYGDEMGMEGAGDPDNRKPMRFGAELTALQEETLAHVQALTAVRHAHPALRQGTRRELLLSSDGLFWAYAMQTRDDLVIVALNRSPTARTETLDLSALQLADGTALADALGGADVTPDGTDLSLTVEGRGAAVLVRK